MDPAGGVLFFEKIPCHHSALVGAGGFGGHGDDDDVLAVGVGTVLVQKSLRAGLGGFGYFRRNLEVLAVFGGVQIIVIENGASFDLQVQRDDRDAVHLAVFTGHIRTGIDQDLDLLHKGSS